MSSLEKRDGFFRLEKARRSQLTIFIIVALAIIAIILLLVVVVPKVQSGDLFRTQSPAEYYDACMKNTLKDNMEKVALGGGYLETQNYYQYKGVKYNYLCYTNEYYKQCVMQQPMIFQQFNSELKRLTLPKAQECLNSMKENYARKGYTVTMQSAPQINMSLEENNLLVDTNVEIKFQKEDTKNYGIISERYPTQMYELISIATSILNFEARLGGSESTVYMAYYPNVRVEKTKLSDGTTLYSLSNRKTGETFRFATRSVAWPPGVDK